MNKSNPNEIDVNGLEIEQVIDLLIYKSFENSRLTYPDFPAYKYEILYPEWERLEARFRELHGESELQLRDCKVN